MLSGLHTPKLSESTGGIYPLAVNRLALCTALSKVVKIGVKMSWSLTVGESSGDERRRLSNRASGGSAWPRWHGGRNETRLTPHARHTMVRTAGPSADNDYDARGMVAMPGWLKATTWAGRNRPPYGFFFTSASGNLSSFLTSTAPFVSCPTRRTTATPLLWFT